MQHSITNRLDEVYEATSELREIQTRIKKLDDERAELEGRAENILSRLANAAATALEGGAVQAPIFRSQPKQRSLAERILGLFDDRPDMELGAGDIANHFGLIGDTARNTIRGTLSRLNSEGRIKKVSYGKYRRRDDDSSPGVRTVA